jgi:transcriptional regulator with XRE-family HTH domain
MSEFGEYLRRRRTELQPADVGLPTTTFRRVMGLRREEVAQPAGVSTDYYTRLEQGRDLSPSDAVLDALAGALELDEAGRALLQHLAHPARPTRRRNVVVQRVRPADRSMLESWTEQPGFVLSRRESPGPHLGSQEVPPPVVGALEIDYEALHCPATPTRPCSGTERPTATPAPPKRSSSSPAGGPSPLPRPRHKPRPPRPGQTAVETLHIHDPRRRRESTSSADGLQQ